MKYLILSVVVLAVIYSAQAKTVEECKEDAKRCKSYIAPLAARSGNSREGFLRAIRTTPLNDICTAASAFLTCGKSVLDSAECSVHEAVSQYQPLYARLSKTVEFICVREKDAVQRAIPCLTSRQFFGKISRCKKNNPCNSEASWNCAKQAVASTCDAATSTWFDSFVPLFQQNHPGCGEDTPLRKLFAALRGQ